MRALPGKEEGLKGAPQRALCGGSVAAAGQHMPGPQCDSRPDPLPPTPTPPRPAMLPLPAPSALATLASTSGVSNERERFMELVEKVGQLFSVF